MWQAAAGGGWAGRKVSGSLRHRVGGCPQLAELAGRGRVFSGRCGARRPPLLPVGSREECAYGIRKMLLLMLLLFILFNFIFLLLLVINV